MAAIHASTSTDQRADSLERVLNGRSELDIAQFQFVGLERLARTDGRTWSRRRDLLWQIAEIYLLNCIEEADILIRGPENFLVIFAERTGARAEFAAQSLADGASDRFHGLTDGPSPELIADTFTVSASWVANLVREHETSVGVPAPDSPSEFQADWLFRSALGSRAKG
jgi:hypothetical protein